MEFSEEDQNKYSIIEVAEKIHGSVSGSGDSLSDELLAEYVEWLEWRTTDGWTPGIIPRFEAYGKAVWSLATSSLQEATEELSLRRRIAEHNKGKRTWIDAPVGSSLEGDAKLSLKKLTEEEKRSAANNVLSALKASSSLKGSFAPYWAEYHRLFTIAYYAVNEAAQSTKLK